jgi:hypothetical protein
MEVVHHEPLGRIGCGERETVLTMIELRFLVTTVYCIAACGLTTTTYQWQYYGRLLFNNAFSYMCPS